MSVTLTARRVQAARIIAMAADLTQLVVFPAFVEGILSPLNDAVDVAVAATLSALLGWHWAFLPSFLSELIPFWDLAPTWTAAVLFVTRGPLPPEPSPPRIGP
jgi:hypothetical protein